MNGFGQMPMMSLGFPASPGFGAPGSNYGGRGRGRGRGRFCCSLRPLPKLIFSSQTSVGAVDVVEEDMVVEELQHPKPLTID